VLYLLVDIFNVKVVLGQKCLLPLSFSPSLPSPSRSFFVVTNFDIYKFLATNFNLFSIMQLQLQQLSKSLIACHFVLSVCLSKASEYKYKIKGRELQQQKGK